MCRNFGNWYFIIKFARIFCKCLFWHQEITSPCLIPLFLVLIIVNLKQSNSNQQLCVRTTFNFTDKKNRTTIVLAEIWNLSVILVFDDLLKNSYHLKASSVPYWSNSSFYNNMRLANTYFLWLLNAACWCLNLKFGELIFYYQKLISIRSWQSVNLNAPENILGFPKLNIYIL